MIPAIQTRYGMHHFRSRAEARWAVFFDAMGWRYAYEPEGFDLPYGPYLPDFFMPDFNAYLEVKPEGKPTYDPKYGTEDRAQILIEELAIATGKLCMIVYGTPFTVWSMSQQTFEAIPGDEIELMHGVMSDFRIGLRGKPEIYRDAVNRATAARFEHGEQG